MKQFFLSVVDSETDVSRELAWPAGAPIPAAGDLFEWQGDSRWVDDIVWKHTVDPIGTPIVYCTIYLLDEEPEPCEQCGQVHP